MRGYRTLHRLSPPVRPEAGFDDLIDLLDAMRPEVVRYTWLVTDTDFLTRPDLGESRLARLVDEAPDHALRISGVELVELAGTVWQTNWGAFLAFDGDVPDIPREELPYSEGRPPSIQHPDALIEIQSVDGGCFEIFSRIPRVHDLLAAHYELEECDSEAAS
jgi:hypothetical protein